MMKKTTMNSQEVDNNEQSRVSEVYDMPLKQTEIFVSFSSLGLY